VGFNFFGHILSVVFYKNDYLLKYFNIYNVVVK